jgi:hypothetical protein
MDERAEFEKWWPTDTYRAVIKPVRDGDSYSSTHATDAWGAWQARATLSAQPGSVSVPRELLERVAKYFYPAHWMEQKEMQAANELRALLAEGGE